MAREHFARHLRVAGFIGPDETKIIQPPEKKKSTETRQQEPIGPRALIQANTVQGRILTAWARISTRRFFLFAD